MARVRWRSLGRQSGWLVVLALSGAAASVGCSPSSGSATNPVIQTFPGGGAAGQPGAGGGPSGGPGAGGQGGVTGAGGIGPGAGGVTPGSGGLGDGGAIGTGGGFGSTGGVPAGAGGLCGTNTVDPSTYPACTTCTGGRCVPDTSLPQSELGLLAACDSSSHCVPEQIVAQADNVLLKPCTSIGGSEGRCTSLCIPAAQNLSAYLPQDTCQSTERCVPCYSPADGSATGICKLGCDPGPNPATQPYVFGHCCGSDGRCAPKSAIPSSIAAQLGQDTCTSSSDLCVPGAPIDNPSYRFPCCSSSFGSGICASSCVLKKVAGALGKGNCSDSNDVCVPCADLSRNPTGACTDTNGQTVTTCVP